MNRVLACPVWLGDRTTGWGWLENTREGALTVVHERLYSAAEVAQRMSWRVNTVYAKRRRSMSKLAEGRELAATDLPTGERIEGQGLRWRATELSAFVTAVRRSRNRGGRPRAIRARAN